MDVKEIKSLLRGIKDNQIKITKHAHKRIQDKRRKINYHKVIQLIKNQKGLYKVEEQTARKKGERKFKLWFRLNYVFDTSMQTRTPLIIVLTTMILF
jgi:hypothetical protein